MAAPTLNFFFLKKKKTGEQKRQFAFRAGVFKNKLVFEKRNFFSNNGVFETYFETFVKMGL